MNRFNSLKQVQHFDAHNSNPKKEKEKKKEKSIQFNFFGRLATLRNILKINEYCTF